MPETLVDDRKLNLKEAKPAKEKKTAQPQSAITKRPKKKTADDDDDDFMEPANPPPVSGNKRKRDNKSVADPDSARPLLLEKPGLSKPETTADKGNGKQHENGKS
jgi:hypothetical protein